MRIMLPLEKKQHYLCHKLSHTVAKRIYNTAPAMWEINPGFRHYFISCCFFLSDLQRHHWHKQPWLLHQLFPSLLPPAPSACFSHLYSTCKLRKAHLTVTEILAHSLIFFSLFTELIFAWYAANFTLPPFLLYKQYSSSKYFLHIW